MSLDQLLSSPTAHSGSQDEATGSADSIRSTVTLVNECERAVRHTRATLTDKYADTLGSGCRLQ